MGQAQSNQRQAELGDHKPQATPKIMFPSSTDHPENPAIGHSLLLSQAGENQGRCGTKPPITIYFNADSFNLNPGSALGSHPEARATVPAGSAAEGAPFRADLHFRPNAERLQVYPGDSALSFYTIHNKTNEPISGISVYNVIPQKAGIYFNKIQCFCFEEQRLKPNESIEMPILFYIDSDFEKDPKMEDVNSIILSYTFYQCAPGNGAQPYSIFPERQDDVMEFLNSNEPSPSLRRDCPSGGQKERG